MNTAVCKPDAERIAQVFEPWRRSDAPGLAVGVAHHGRVILRQGFGLASASLPLALSPQLRMRIGSTSKQLCALAVMLLAEEGKLAPDGARLRLRLGGKTSALSGEPLDVDAEVLCLRDDARQAWFAQGEPRALLGRSAALRVGGIEVVANSTHFAHGFAPLAGHIVYAASPGSVAFDPALFALQRAPRPVFPLDHGFVPEPVFWHFAAH